MSTNRLRKYVTDLRTLPGDMMKGWRVGGASSAWIELRRRTLDRAGGYSRMLVIETDLAGFTQPPSRPDLEIESFAGPDWSSLGDLVGARIAARFAAATAAGRQCIVARRGGHALGYFWVSPVVEPRFESFELPLPLDAIFIWQTLVTRNARRLGVGSALARFGLYRARQAGYRRSWSVIHPANTPSLRAVGLVGPSRVLGSVTRFKLLSAMHSRYRELPRPHPVAALLPA